MSRNHTARRQEASGGDGDYEGAVEIKIERETTSADTAAASSPSDEREEEEDDSLPFPVPMDAHTLNRTSLLELHANDSTNAVSREPTATKPAVNKWKQAGQQIAAEQRRARKATSPGRAVSPATRAWSNMYRMIQSAPNNTKLFLGIEPSGTTSTSGGGGGGGGGGVSSSKLGGSNSGALNTALAGSRGGGSNALSAHGKPPLSINKALNNWNQRTFRVLNSNPIFGGKLKEAALDRYMDNLDESVADQTDAFLVYKETGGSQFDLGPDERLSVANLAMRGVARLFANKSSSSKHSNKNEKLTQKQLDPGSVFETTVPAAVPPRPLLKFAAAGVARSGSDNDNDGGDEFGFDVPDSRDRYQPQPSHDAYAAAVDEPEDNEEGPCDAFTHACSGKRVFGIGFCGRLCDNDLDPHKKSAYDDLLRTIKQHRPYFTYWVTFVQTVVCLVSLFAYGVAPVGFSFTLKRGLATTVNLEKQLISYPVKQNFWIGPAAMDLVHLGAKYAPCMRNDSNIYGALELDRRREQQSACCVRNDRGGCVQTTRDKCSELLSHFDKWNGSTSDRGGGAARTSGSVCGLDPEFCSDADAHRWPADDITQWPRCDKPTAVFNSSLEQSAHMYCEIIGRPCCVGIQGECVVTTLEHCTLLRGYFHDDAHLCAQVDCMQDVCGMIDFLNAKSPDQVYRLFTSIFIHAGIVQLLVTVLFQLFILRDVEKLAGCLRVAIVYLASGVVGNLGSALFLPYQAEVGPLGSQFGIVACLFVEMFHAWEIYAAPWTALLKLSACLFGLVLVGFLPMIDNFANIFGFLAGLLLGAILFPNINLNGKCRRVLIIAVCISLVVCTVGALVVLFYVKPIDQCSWCKFLSCPFGSDYCLDMDFNITRLN